MRGLLIVTVVLAITTAAVATPPDFRRVEVLRERGRKGPVGACIFMEALAHDPDTGTEIPDRWIVSGTFDGFADPVELRRHRSDRGNVTRYSARGPRGQFVRAVWRGSQDRLRSLRVFRARFVVVVAGKRQTLRFSRDDVIGVNGC